MDGSRPKIVKLSNSRKPLFCSTKTYRYGVYLAFIAGLISCSRKSSSSSSDASDPKDSKYHVDNYKPEKVYKVDEFSLQSINIIAPFSPLAQMNLGETPTLEASFPLSEFTMPIEHPTSENMFLNATQSPRFYSGFPIQIDFAIKVRGKALSTLVNFGLMEAVGKGATEAQKQNLQVCNLGSSTISHPGSKTQDGTVNFSASFVIPDNCLKGNKEQKMMLFVALDPEGAVEPSEGRKNLTLVFDPETIAARKVCFKPTPESPCAESIVVAPPPGVNARFVSFAGESSVAVLPKVDPIQMAASEDQEQLPFFKAKGEIALDGLKLDPNSAKGYRAEISYDLCPYDGNKESVSQTCGASEGWRSLQAIEGSFPENPSQTSASSKISEFTPGEAKGFSANLFALGDTYALLSKTAQGAWSGSSQFLVRACLKPFLNEKELKQKNLDAQLGSGDGRSDDCMVFPVALVDSSDDQATESPAANELPPDEFAETFLTNPSFAELGNSADAAPAIVNEGAKAIFGKIYENSWGPKAFQLTAALGKQAELNETELKGTDVFELGLKGFVNTTAYRVALNSRGDMINGTDNWVEPSLTVFDLKLYGLRIRAGQKIDYQFPISEISKSKRDKTKNKVSGAKAKKKKKFKPGSDEVENVNDTNPSPIVVKELCKNPRVPMSVITLTVKLCAEGGLYFDTGVRLSVYSVPDADKGTYNAGNFLGRVAGYATPSVAMSATVEAAVDVVLVRGGVGGKLVLIEIGFPSQFGVEGGYTVFDNYMKNPFERKAIRVNRVFETGMNIDWMSGRIYAFADLRALDWCRKWFVIYPCGFTWSRVADVTITSFQGGNVNVPFFNAKGPAQFYLPVYKGPAPTPKPLTLAVSAYSPANGATSVAANQVAEVSFTRSLNTATVNTTNVTVKEGNNTLGATFAFAENNRKLRITPSSAWPLGKIVTVTLGTGLRNGDGGALASAQSYSFAVVAGSALTLAGTPYTPPTGSVEVALNRVIWVDFAKALNTSTVTATNVTVRQSTTDLPVTYTFGNSNTRVLITPTSPWPQGATVTVTLGTGLRADDGGALASAQSMSFLTLDNNSLVAQYNFEDNVTDAKGTYNGTLANGTYSSDSKVGSKSLSFNGTSTAITLGNVDFGNTFSIAVWVKLSDPVKSSLNTILSNGLGGIEKNGFKLFFNDGGDSNRNAMIEAGNGTLNQSTKYGTLLGAQNGTLTAGVWTHVVYVVQKLGATNADRAKFYRDGQSFPLSKAPSTDGSVSNDIPTNYATSGQMTCIGTFPVTGTPQTCTDAPFYFQGLMDDFRIYNKALTLQEIQSIKDPP